MDTVCETPCLLDSSVGMATQDPFFLQVSVYFPQLLQVAYALKINTSKIYISSLNILHYYTKAQTLTNKFNLRIT